MAKHCGKHDIHGDVCWCCEEAAMTKGDRDLAYQDPEFLAKRGGAQGKVVVMSNTMHQLSQLSPEHLQNLIALAKGEPTKRQMITA